MGHDKVSGGVTVLCWLDGNLPKFGNEVKTGNKVQFGNKFTKWCNVRSNEGVTVYGHVQECHGRERLHNI